VSSEISDFKLKPGLQPPGFFNPKSKIPNPKWNVVEAAGIEPASKGCDQ
jgi:hypothetical protein